MRRAITRPLWVLLVLMFPGVVCAQFSALRWVDVPAVGSWAEYLRTQAIGNDKVYMKLKLSVVGSRNVDGVDYVWFELSSQIDDLYEIADDRLPYTARFRLRKDDVKRCENELIERLGDFVIKLGDRPAVRIPASLKEQAIAKGYLSGGVQGSGSCIEYTFEDLGKETIEVEAGKFACTHRKGKGKSRVVTNVESKRTAEVDSLLDLWVDPEVPFGIVKSMNHIFGKGPDVKMVSLRVDTEETYILRAYGTDAVSTIGTEPKPYSLDDVTTKVKPPPGE